jgi:sulfur carrier protein
MRIELNGREVDVADGASVAELVAQAGAREDTRGVAVALDGEVVPRGEWNETHVEAGQAVEVLEAIQGG